MSLDKKLDALLSNVTPALRDVLRTAYDLGYREALAAGASLHGSSTHARGAEDDVDVEPQPGSREDAAPGTDDADGGAAGLDESVSVPPASFGSPGTAVDWSGSGAASESAGEVVDLTTKKVPLLRILPHATVGTLWDRIMYHFDLARFDIEVVICRKGDRDRRQLKSSVRLSKYEVET
jgi:hypothetical protein